MPRRTADDRSREVTLIGLRSDPARWFRSCPVPRDVHRRIGKRARSVSGSKRKSATHGAAGMYIGGVFGLMFCYRGLSENYPELAQGLMVGGIAGLTGLLLYRVTKDDSLNRYIVAAFLDEHCCPACGHDLAGLTPADDGCSICGECGAAWRLAVGPNPAR